MAEVTETNIQTDVPAENQSVERCLTFESGDMTLFLSINNVTEIINDCAITHLPLVPDYIKGIINLRGQILPVVDIRLYMGKPALEYNSKTCFIVLNVDDLPVCIVVDSVQQVIDIDLQDVRPIPIKRRQKLLDGMITLENGTVLMSFDCKSLVSPKCTPGIFLYLILREDFLSVAKAGAGKTPRVHPIPKEVIQCLH